MKYNDTNDLATYVYSSEFVPKFLSSEYACKSNNERINVYCIINDVWHANM